MNTQRHAAKRHQQEIEPHELAVEAMRGVKTAWNELDSVYLDLAAGDPSRVARLCRSGGRETEGHVRHSFAVIRYARRTYDDEPANPPWTPAGMRAGGRDYSLALVALLEALASEPSSSPLAASMPLDDLRAAASLVAGETAAASPDLPLVDRAVRRVDRRLANLRLPLRATGYLAARDSLRRLVARELEAGLAGGP